MNDKIVRDNKFLESYSGHENLEVLSQNRRFNDWIYEHISPGLKGDVLEVGSGLGTFSEKIIHDLPTSNIALTDLSLPYVNVLREKFCTTNPKVSSCKLDLDCLADYERIGYEEFDSILAINVLEHVEKDEFALLQLYKMLKNEGRLIILVPSHKFLYNAIDRHIGHFRRYTKRDIESKIRTTQFTIENMFYFNTLGIIGWYVSGNLVRRRKIGRAASQLFDTTVPLARSIDKIMCKKIGLSIICYLLKN